MPSLKGLDQCVCVCVCVCVYTVGTESIQTPLNCSLFVILQPFPSLLYTQHSILTEEHRTVDIFAHLLKKNAVLSIQTLCSVFSPLQFCQVGW